MHNVPYGETVKLLETSEAPPGAEPTFIGSVVKVIGTTYDENGYVKVSFQGKTRYVKAYIEVELANGPVLSEN